MNASLLLVDDDIVFRTRLARALGERGFDVDVAGSVADALALVGDDPPEYCVVDLRMPGEPGLVLLDRVLALDPATRVVVLTGWGSVATAVDAMKRGAVHYLQKPVDADAVVAALTGANDDAAAVAAPVVEAATPSLARAEWEYIHKVLAECDHSVSAAARRLGLHRRSLQRKLQKHPPAR